MTTPPNRARSAGDPLEDIRNRFQNSDDQAGRANTEEALSTWRERDGDPEHRPGCSRLLSGGRTGMAGEDQ